MSEKYDPIEHSMSKTMMFREDENVSSFGFVFGKK